ARDARLPIDDDLVADEPALQRGRQGEERRGRIAARVRDQPRAADPIAGQLGQAVDGFGEERGRGMRVTVPALVEHGIPQAKVGADVDDRAALVEPRTGLLRGLTRRKRGEDDLSVAEVKARTGDEIADCAGHEYLAGECERADARGNVDSHSPDGNPSKLDLPRVYSGASLESDRFVFA